MKEIEIADDFYKVYKRCFKADKNHHIVSIPAFVNGLFASEFYLKVLLGNKVKNIVNKADRHNLKLLYELLDNKYKEEIKSINCDSRYTLYELLTNIGDGFKIWRYIFEDGNEKFDNGKPFDYTETFLNIYLPALKDITHKNIIS